MQPADLIAFLRKNGFLPYQEDIDDIFRRLDTNKDDRLSYLEFVEGVLPVEAYKVPAYRHEYLSLYPELYRYPYYLER